MTKLVAFKVILAMMRSNLIAKRGILWRVAEHWKQQYINTSSQLINQKCVWSRSSKIHNEYEIWPLKCVKWHFDHNAGLASSNNNSVSM